MRPQPPPSGPVLPEDVVAAALRAPLYRSLVGDREPGTELGAWPVHRDADLLAAGDPFGGRRDPSSLPVTITQACDDAPLYWALAPDELGSMARVLAACWTALGLVRGDRVGIHDYGSSPVTRFASRYFHAHLDAGAAELTGCIPICNDGLAELVDRAAHLVEFVRPRVLFVAAHAAMPLQGALAARRLEAPLALVVSADEEPWTSDALARLRSTEVPAVTQILRSDLGLLLAPPCRDDPASFHPDPAVYAVEVFDDATGSVLDDPGARGPLVVTHREIRTSPVIRYVTDVPVDLGRTDCRCEDAAICVTVAA
jgi:phenylacetate-coenzyme A ligase PaaK-like adenylate-forming protein